MLKLKPNATVEINWVDLYQNITPQKIDELTEQFSQKFSVPKNKIKIVKKYIQKSSDITSHGSQNVSSVVLDTVLNPTLLQENYRDFLRKYHPTVDVKEFFEIDKQVSALMPKIDEFDTRDRRYKILYIKGKNILSYGDFFRDIENSKGVNHIYSDPVNQGGKSALTRMIAILLFGEDIKESFNNFTKDNTAFIEGEVSTSEETYFLRRDLKKKWTPTKPHPFEIEHKFSIYVYDEAGTDVINGRNATNIGIKDSIQSLKKFEKIIGTHKDYVFAAYYEYHNIEKWIQTSKIARYRLFCEYLGLALLESKYQVAKTMLNTHLKQSMSGKYNIAELELSNESLKEELLQLKQDRTDFESNLSLLTSSLTETTLKIQQLYESKSPIDLIYESFDLVLAQQNLEHLEFDLSTLETQYKDFLKQNVKDKEYIENSKSLEFYTREKTHLEKRYKSVVADIEYTDSQSEFEKQLLNVKNSEKLIETELKYKNQLTEYDVQYRTLTSELKVLAVQIDDMPDEISCKKCGNIENTALEKESLRLEQTSKELELNKVKNSHSDLKLKLNDLLVEMEQEIKESHQQIQTKINTVKAQIEANIDCKQSTIQKDIDSCNTTIQYFKDIEIRAEQLSILTDKIANQTTQAELKSKEIQKFLSNIDKIEINKNIQLEINNLNEQLKTINSDILSQNKSINSTNEQINLNEYKLKTNKELIEGLRKDYTIEKALKLYLHVHSEDGLSKHIILSILPQINTDLATSLEGICDFELYMSFDDKKIEFIYVKDGVKQELEKGCGFEKTLSCLALHYVNCKMTTLPIPNNLILDEILGRVGAVNYESIVKITKKLSEIFYSVDIITHGLDEESKVILSELIDREILITKENNISKIKLITTNK